MDVKVRIFLLACTSLIALILLPTHLFADGPCAPPEYSNCGTPLAPVTFTLQNVGFGFPAVDILWYAKFANWRDSIYVHDLTTGYTSPLSWSNQDGQTKGTELLLTPPGANMNYGDQLEFVLHVDKDPHFPHGVEYCEGLSACYKDFNGGTQIGHVYAETLDHASCLQDTGFSCLFLGFEDEPFKFSGDSNYHADYDYNDFEIEAYGITLNGAQRFAEVPEPSSIILLAGAPLAFALRKLKSLV